MRNFTKIVLSLAMAFGLLGGVSSVKAGKVYGTVSIANDCSWNAETKTATFTGVNGWEILYSGLPSGDITSYTKFHVTLSEMSANINNIRFLFFDKFTNIFL